MQTYTLDEEKISKYLDRKIGILKLLITYEKM